MNSEERRKLEKNLQEQGEKKSAYDSNTWLNGSDKIKFTGSNSVNDNGTGYSGYGTIKDHFDKKK